MATSYTKTNWQDAPSTVTPITAAQLNRMEKGIGDCSSQGNANELAIAANAEAIQTLESGIQLGSISITQLLLMAHPIGDIYSSTASSDISIIAEVSSSSSLPELYISILYFAIRASGREKQSIPNIAVKNIIPHFSIRKLK